MPVSGRERRFVELFAQEGRRRLASLAESALLLEVPSGDPDAEWELVDAMFRDAHSVKGGAAIVGLTDLSRVAHALEDVLESLRDRPATGDPALVDRVLAGVDVCGELLDRALRLPAGPAAGGPGPAGAAPPPVEGLAHPRRPRERGTAPAGRGATRGGPGGRGGRPIP